MPLVLDLCCIQDSAKTKHVSAEHYRSATLKLLIPVLALNFDLLPAAYRNSSTSKAAAQSRFPTPQCAAHAQAKPAVPMQG